jgi:hypothetical protein
MTAAGYLSFHLSDRPIREPVTKFGGNPVWLGPPEWPVSRRTGEPMGFIGQVALDPAIFGAAEGKMAYLFLNDTPSFWGVPNYEPDGGENGVVVQPGDNRHLRTRPFAEGPSIYRVEKGRRRFLLFRERLRVPAEYGVSLTRREEPDLD